jgi:hypothetical protein
MNKTKTISVRADTELLELVGRAAKRTRLTQSEFLRQAIVQGTPLVVAGLGAARRPLLHYLEMFSSELKIKPDRTPVTRSRFA